MQLVDLIAAPPLVLIAWEDLKERSIHWWWLPITLTALLAAPFLSGGLADHLHQSLLNTGLLSLMCSGAYMLLVLKRRRLFNPLLGTIGIGDLLFLLVLAIGLPAAEYFPFLITGLALCLVIWVLFGRFMTQAHRTIPLAGLLALYLIVWITLSDIVSLPLWIASTLP